MNRYDPYTDSFISDDIDMRSYMLGYLAGCSDSLNKYKTLTDPNTYIPLTTITNSLEVKNNEIDN